MYNKKIRDKSVVGVVQVVSDFHKFESIFIYLLNQLNYENCIY